MVRIPALLLLLIGLVPAQDATVSLVRVSLATAGQAQLLASLDLDVAATRSGAAEVLIHGPAELAVLRSAGFNPVVVHRDLAGFYASRLTPLHVDGGGPPGFGQGSMGGYYTWAEMVAVMDALAAQHPQIMAPKVSLGLSIEGRELWMWKISDNPLANENEPEILVDGLHHAREPISMHAAVYFARHLVAGYGTDPGITTLVNTRQVYIVPAVNPDGYVYNETASPLGGGLWRKNRRVNPDGSRGVDLNRNYGYQWGYDNVGSSPTPAAETFRGAGPFSEPCTQAMSAFAQAHQIQLGLTLHSYGGQIFIPPGYAYNAVAPQPLGSAYEALASELAALVPGSIAGPAWSLLAPANGTTEDWWFGALYGGHQTWGFSAELGNTADGFWPATNRIVPICDEALALQMHLLRVAGSDLRLPPESVSVTETGGTAPGAWEPGEVLHIVAGPTNGGTLADDVTLRIETSSPWLQVLNGPVSVGTVPAFSSGVNTGNPLLVAISPAAPPGAVLSFAVIAESPFSPPALVTISQGVSLQPLIAASDDFESLSVPTWTVGAPGDNATGGLWTRQDPTGTSLNGQALNPEDDHTPAPGTQCWFTGQGPVGGLAFTNDVDGITTLVSPIFDLSHVQTPVVSYWRWFATTVATDSLAVEMSNDGGQNWVLVDNVHSTQTPWRYHQFAVESFLPRTSAMRFRFRASDWPNVGVCEAAVDDFQIRGFHPALDVAASGTAYTGSTVSLGLSAPFWPGATYVLGCAASAHSGIPTPAGLVPLDVDALFLAVPLFPGIFDGFLGQLNAQGLGQGHIHLPPDPALAGFPFLTAAAVGQGSSLLAVSGGIRLVIQ